MSASIVQAEDNDRFARLVLFIPEEAEPQPNYQERLGSLALRTEAFFAQWMKHWERPIERSQIFARNEDGAIDVTLVKSDLLNSNGRAALPEIRRKAVMGATKQLEISQNGIPVIWWVFYDYPGVQGFQGGARGAGGIAVNAYPKGEEPIDLEAELAEGALSEMAIKGTIHEFGHALGLPHIGPRPSIDLGNTLMGPINRVFWQRSGSDDVRVYLSEASAAAVWKHPIFRSEKTPEPSMPAKISVKDLKVKESENGKRIVISGTLSADQS
ncbi:MAG: hypothetical protein AAF585_21325, partial [Verrucomicrobiota bacterium]